MLKRNIYIILISMMFMLFTTFINVYASVPQYEDVKEVDWFYDATEHHYNKGIMTGLTETKFGPYEELSRAQMVTILYRMHGSPWLSYVNTSSEKYKDITETEWLGWYGNALWWAWNNGIVSGYENGCFGPADSITREQLCVMLYRYAERAGMDVKKLADISMFYDAEGVSDFALNAVKWAVEAGVLTGKENGTVLDPHGTATRAEAAVMIYRFEMKINEVITGYQLTVDENNITSKNEVEYYKNRDSVLVPFVEVMVAAGADITWTSESVVDISYKDMECMFDMDQRMLVDKNIGRWFEMPSGTDLDTHCKIVDKELLLDTESFENILRCMEVYVEFDVNHQSKEIIVDFLDDVIEPDNYKLIVNGQDITEGNYLEVHKNYQYTLVPVTAVLETLGAEVEWTSETIADITLGTKEYVLDIENVSLIKKNDEYDLNYIMPAPGGQMRYKTIDGELLLDDITFQASVMQMGMEIMVRVNVDYNNHNILIEYR